MKKILSVIFSITIGLSSCTNDNDNENPNNCDLETILSAGQFTTAPSDQLTIKSLKIENNCLKINFSSSGCSGNTWEIKLIDSGNILESNPPQRNLRLSLKNEEFCDAFITKELTFDISNLKVNVNKVLLNISNFDDKFLYEY
jgi:hypothetical protein